MPSTRDFWHLNRTSGRCMADATGRPSAGAAGRTGAVRLMVLSLVGTVLGCLVGVAMTSLLSRLALSHSRTDERLLAPVLVGGRTTRRTSEHLAPAAGPT